MLTHPTQYAIVNDRSIFEFREIWCEIFTCTIWGGHCIDCVLFKCYYSIDIGIRGNC